MEIAFWVMAGFLLYTYAGYPLVLCLAVPLFRKPLQRETHTPSVSLVIAAYNEEKAIRAKIENCLSLDYPRERMEIIVASDGSTDNTNDAVSAFRKDGVILRAFPDRRGKPSLLNDTVSAVRGEIVVLADARQTLSPDSLKILVSAFADPTVGAVSGELVFQESAGSPIAAGMGCYWNYEKFIRKREAELDSTVGATGAIYAIRRELFEPIPADALLDDLWIPMNIVRRGYRVVFESNAIVYDRPSRTANQEVSRKMRTIGGNFQFFARNLWTLFPWENRIWFSMLSHKVLRLAAPVWLVGVLVVNGLLLTRHVFYVATLAGQALFYALALSGAFFGQRAAPRWIGVPYTFCLLNVVTAASFWTFVMGRMDVRWKSS